MQKLLIRNLEAWTHLETFLICAVSTVFLTRFYLDLSNYPQLGGSLHIAHMLWGGLLMLVSIVILLSLFNKSANKIASIVGGIGFGLFIDELGKFVTKDNDYFFEPTIAVIYIIFILLFLLFRALEKRGGLSEDEYLLNAVELTRLALLDKKNSQKKFQAIEFIKTYGEGQAINPPLLTILQSLKENLEVKNNFFTGWKNIFHQIVHSSLFTKGVVGFFILYSLYNLYMAYRVISLYWQVEDFTLSFIDWGEFGGSLVAAIIVILGIFRLPFSKPGAVTLFKTATLVSIFLTQFFAFYRNQLTAGIGLIVNLLVLLALQNFSNQRKDNLFFSTV